MNSPAKNGFDRSRPPSNLTRPLCLLFALISLETLATAQEFVVENLANAVVGSTPIGRIAVNRQTSNAFTTGAATQGYELQSVTLAFAATTGTPPNIKVEVLPALGLDPDVTNTLGTLSGNNPSVAGNYTYTANGITLAPNTTYFVMASAFGGADNSFYAWESSSSPIDVGDAGWSIEDRGRLFNTGPLWIDGGNNSKFGITATPVPEPTAFSALTTLALCLFGYLRQRSRPE